MVTLTEDQVEHQGNDETEHAPSKAGPKSSQSAETALATSAGSTAVEKPSEKIAADTGDIVSVILKEDSEGDQQPPASMTMVPSTDGQPESSSSSKEVGESTKPDLDHLPEPPASPVSNTAFSGSGTSTATSAMPDLPAKPVTSTGRLPSPNRLSVAYAQGTRRLLIDAEVVEKMILFRAEGRIEIEFVVEPINDGFKGILVLLFCFCIALSPVQCLLLSALD